MIRTQLINQQPHSGATRNGHINLKKIFGTHNGAFHADDVFAIAALSLLHPDYEVHRSRDPEVWAQCDFLVDIGGRYNHDEKVYDHHFKDGPTYDDGLKMSSIGLIWSHYGEEICGCPIVAERVCNRLIRSLDANDNGIATSQPLDEYSNVREVSLSGSISMMNPQDRTQADEAFGIEVARARLLLKAAMASSQKWLDSRDGLQKCLKEALDDSRQYILVPDNCKWPEHLFNSEGNEAILYAVYQNGEKWFAQAVPSAPGEFSNRKDFPSAWAGLNDDEFSAAANIPDGVFCHQNLFLCASGSRESTLKLVADAINA